MLMDLIALSRAPRLVVQVECRNAAGELVWQDEAHNLVTTVGKALALSAITGLAAAPALFLGAKGIGAPAVTDTLASHPTWTETAAYAAATLPAVAWGAVTATGGSAQSVAAVINFAMNAAYTFSGCFLSTNSAKGATTGTLYNAVDFGTPRTGGSGDTIAVTMTLTQS